MADLEKWKRVGERVGALILIRGYRSVELFAHENEIDKSVLNRLIRGRREVRLSTFLKILEALEVSIPELYSGAGLTVREKDYSPEGRALPSSKAKPPETGTRVFKFTRDEFERLEIRKTTRDKTPIVIETSGKKNPSLSLKSKTFRLEL